MAFIDGSVVTVALPAIQADLATSVAGAQWVANAYMLMLGALILVGGSAGDRFGRRRVFALGVAIFAAASVACGLAPNTATLIGAGFPLSPKNDADISSALSSISAAGRPAWLMCGAALHRLAATWGDRAREIWDAWAATCPEKFDARDQGRTWNSFKDDRAGRHLSVDPQRCILRPTSASPFMQRCRVALLSLSVSLAGMRPSGAITFRRYWLEVSSLSPQVSPT